MGNNGFNTQLPGQATTVSAVAGATGGIGAGNLVTPDIDKQLLQFMSDDTPMMQIMLMGKKVQVTSPEVLHFMIDAPRSYVTTNAAVAENKSAIGPFKLPLSASDAPLLQKDTTLMISSVKGYDASGTKASGRGLMLIVVGNSDDGSVLVQALNGPKQVQTQLRCGYPAIPANSKVIILANAMTETQKFVAPSTMVPQSRIIYLQKRGMNQVVSDYFDKQAKNLPFAQATIAESTINAFRLEGNRSLYCSVGSKSVSNTPLGPQTRYTMTGIIEQIERSWHPRSTWTFEDFVALTKLIFTGNDVPKRVVVLAGKNLLEAIQCIDFSKHPEVTFSVTTNNFGWTVSKVHTIFGDIEFKHEPTLDRIDMSNSAFVIDPDRVVHYTYSQEHSVNERVEGEEATRKGVIVWDGIGLKGTSHMIINGEGNKRTLTLKNFHPWSSSEVPLIADENRVYLLTVDCPAIDPNAVAGTMWRKKADAWVEYTDTVSV